MDAFIKPSEALRVATINTLNLDEKYVERFDTIVKEAATKNVDVLLLQEVLGVHYVAVVDILEKYEFTYHVFSRPGKKLSNEPYGSGNGVASRIRVDSHKIIPFTYGVDLLRAVSTQIMFNNHEVHLISTHNCWGGDKGHVRLSQTVVLNDYAVKVKKMNPKAVVVLGGDFNDEPDAESVRFLKGKSSVLDRDSAFWVDTAHKTSLETAPTTRPYGEWGTKTALSTGILNPAQIPERHLDYLFVHGWVYGKVGFPSNTQLFGTTLTPDGSELSDHYGIMSDIWLPKL